MSATQPLRFWLNGRVCQVDGVDPHTSLLDYLREQAGLTGTKEGCAEGDCGACTVALLEPDGERVQVRPINSCIRFLPTLQGRGVVTVEGLGSARGELHPVQQAMVDCHASQCGFCTPGFVMSLFALFKSDPAPDRQAVCNALAGNLCRCTGYRPILDAAQAMYSHTSGAATSWWRQPGTSGQAGNGNSNEAEAQLARALAALAPPPGTWTYEAADVRFHAPDSIAALADLVADQPQAWVLAGGTDIALWVNKALQETRSFIWTGNVTELHRIEATPTHLSIGAGATLDKAFEALEAHWPAFSEVWRRFASPPVRASGTLGGNIANGSPIGDSLPVLIALGAQVVLRHRGSTRRLPLESLYLDYKRQARAAGEWIERAEIPWTLPSHRLAAYKISKRPTQDISAVLAAFNIEVDSQGRVASARLAYGGLAGIPRRSLQAEASLLGQPFGAAAFEAAAAALAQDFAPISDMRAGAAYRVRVAAQLLLRFCDEHSPAAHAVPVRVL